MVTVPPVMFKIREELLPLIASILAPGPMMVRFLLKLIWPDVRVIVPDTPLRSIVSPEMASAIA
ncbi:hypothetical protein MBAV_001901 [Candidatus Magnetobacterium bavaricum]|uniref:Uncharacterized protein n=1 Tax=Candidatus Magnetobacterium bavaricum TaxID=29290 RepID=A0A0F3GVJ5_9BACT|nr:hypothetical protein MBAV_001901 [Candidatus Magnetobacterium bavaricum]